MVNTSKQYVEAIAGVHPFQKYLLEHGEAFDGFSKESVQACGKRLSGAKKCFYNSQLCALQTEGFKYYEGYSNCESSRGKLLPVDHAWLVKDGEVFDPTFARIVKGKPWCKTADYFGVEIPLDKVRFTCLNKGICEQLLWQHISEKVKR